MICNEHFIRTVKNLAILVFFEIMTLDFELAKRFNQRHPLSLIYDDVTI